MHLPATHKNKQRIKTHMRKSKTARLRQVHVHIHTTLPIHNNNEQQLTCIFNPDTRTPQTTVALSVKVYNNFQINR